MQKDMEFESKPSSIAMILLAILSTFSVLTPQVKAQEIVWNTNPIPLPTPTTDIWNSVEIYNGRVYLIGGLNLTHYTEKVYFANINPDGTVGSWSATTPLPEGRGAGAVLVWNNLVYVIGGLGPTWGGRTSQHTVFYARFNSDGTIGEWKTTTSLPVRIGSFAGVVWKGKIYVVGGMDGYSHRDEVYYVQINPDGSLGSWETTTSLPFAYVGMGGVAYDDKIYMIGGMLANVQGLRSVYIASINQDGTLGYWHEASPLPEVRSYAGVTLAGEDIYVVGGQGLSDGDFRKTVYRAHAKKLDWEEISQSLPEPREAHCVVASQDRLYVIGGDAGKVGGQLLRRDTIYYSSPLTATELPFWMHWWFWTNIILGISTVVFASTTIYYRKKAFVTKQPKVTSAKPESKEYRVCPNCGASLPADSKFCGKCGTTL